MQTLKTLFGRAGFSRHSIVFAQMGFARGIRPISYASQPIMSVAFHELAEEFAEEMVGTFLAAHLGREKHAALAVQIRSGAEGELYFSTNHFQNIACVEARNLLDSHTDLHASKR
jgi:hypothetical protein